MRARDCFQKWDQLTFLEKWILVTCCYLPPKAISSTKNNRRFQSLDHYQSVYERAFGKELWNIINGKVVLDFGCGYGEFVLAMAARGAKRVIGIDIQDNIEQGRRKALELGISNVEFVLGESHKIPENSVDVVTSHDAFEHFDNPREILMEMIRMTKPGGFILVKFGPTWMSPWGKHMFGTFRKDRPWIHLIFPEKSIMRVHSVYHNEEVLLEKYCQRRGGLNKMTVNKCKKILKELPNTELCHFKIKMLFGFDFFTKIPFLYEFFASGVYFKLKVNK